MSVRILEGDALTVLRALPDCSVQMCVTSPPYFGLRDYGVGGQLGLEKTPDLYVEAMVGVFREVKRVLRDDGTLWLNIGSSYASSGGERQYGSYDGATGRGPGARRYRNVPAYGTDGIALQDSPAIGSSYSDLCDGCRDAIQSRRDRTADSGRHPEPTEQPCATTGHDTEQLASAPGEIGDGPPSVRASTSPESSPLSLAECSHCDNCGVCLSVLRSSLRDSRLCAHMSVGNDGTAPTPQPLGVRIGDKEPSFSAYSNITSLRFKPKDLIPIPWMLAMALQADGWYLRADIIWSKPNPMPESVTDRPTKSHEYLFLLSKSATYYYDADAIAEPSSELSGWAKQRARGEDTWSYNDTPARVAATGQRTEANTFGKNGSRNRRSVWTITTQAYSEAHFATFPPKLIEPCILAGSAKGQTVLDPFGGAGTTGLVADRLGRDALLIELNPKYAEMARRRIHSDNPLFGDVA